MVTPGSRQSGNGNGYHARCENEEAAAILRDHLYRIGHIQIADCPGRHQTGTGETDFKILLPEIDRMGYSGIRLAGVYSSPPTP